MGEQVARLRVRLIWVILPLIPLVYFTQGVITERTGITHTLSASYLRSHSALEEIIACVFLWALWGASAMLSDIVDREGFLIRYGLTIKGKFYGYARLRKWKECDIRVIDIWPGPWISLKNNVPMLCPIFHTNYKGIARMIAKYGLSRVKFEAHKDYFRSFLTEGDKECE
ncbi:MAG TPA: hypothetical protein VKF42_03545 [Chitinivibrionales bacterium]|nr:hypothetical protein [Chitinivibrionales bacterium]